jgi:hypothetical protein
VWRLAAPGLLLRLSRPLLAGKLLARMRLAGKLLARKLLAGKLLARKLLAGELRPGELRLPVQLLLHEQRRRRGPQPLILDCRPLLAGRAVLRRVAEPGQRDDQQAEDQGDDAERDPVAGGVGGQPVHHPEHAEQDQPHTDGQGRGDAAVTQVGPGGAGDQRGGQREAGHQEAAEEQLRRGPVVVAEHVDQRDERGEHGHRHRAEQGGGEGGRERHPPGRRIGGRVARGRVGRRHGSTVAINAAVVRPLGGPARK